MTDPADNRPIGFAHMIFFVGDVWPAPDDAF
jgi:hypothetical protein